MGNVLAHFFVLLFVSTTYQFIVYTLHYTVTPKSDQNIGWSRRSLRSADEKVYYSKEEHHIRFKKKLFSAFDYLEKYMLFTLDLLM
jgi:hypothetical protein